MKTTRKTEQGKQRILFLTLVLCAAIGSMTTGCAKAKVTEKEMTAELGSDISSDPRDYMTVRDDSMYDDMTVDLSGVDADKVGEYKIVITYKDEKTYEVALTIEDTTAPSISPVSYFAIQPEKEIKAEDILGEVKDKSGTVQTYIVSCEKEADFEDIEVTKESLDKLSAEVSEEKEFTITNEESLVTESEEGEYILTAAAVDESGNASVAEIHLYVDGTAPTITLPSDDITVDVSDYTTESTDLYEIVDELHARADEIGFRYEWEDNSFFDCDTVEFNFKSNDIEFKDNNIIESAFLSCSGTDIAGNSAETSVEFNIIYEGVNGSQLFAQGGGIPNGNSNNNSGGIGSAGQSSNGGTGNSGNSGSGESAGSSTAVAAGYHPEMAQELFNYINQERAARGLNTLVWNDKLATLANSRAVEITTNFDHKRVDGTYVYNYDLDNGCYLPPNECWFGPNGRGIGENCGNAGPGPDAFSVSLMHNGFMGSQGHRNNLLDSNWTDCAVAAYVTSDGKVYYVELFL